MYICIILLFVDTCDISTNKTTSGHNKRRYVGASCFSDCQHVYPKEELVAKWEIFDILDKGFGLEEEYTFPHSWETFIAEFPPKKLPKPKKERIIFPLPREPTQEEIEKFKASLHPIKDEIFPTVLACDPRPQL